MAIAEGKYDVMLVAKHGLYPPKLQPQEGRHNIMCMLSKGTYTPLSYNTNDGDNVSWDQYSSTGVTVNSNMKSQMASKGANPSKLGRWTWVQFVGKASEATMFVSTYCPYKNKKGILAVWNQQVCYFQRKTERERLKS